MPRIACFALIPLLFLSGCSQEEKDVQASGARSAALTIHAIANRSANTMRPSASIGIFASLFVAQGVFLPVQSAAAGIDAQMLLLKGQTQIEANETFALLQEIGGIIQIDIADILNRSNDRIKTLESYLRSLSNVSILTERKIKELDTQLEQLKKAKKEQRSTVRDLQRSISSSLKAKDYITAGELEPELIESQGTLAETDSKLDQTDDITKRFKSLFSIAIERMDAIDKNRPILLTGNRVIEVPGIEDFNILIEGKKWKSGSSDIFGKKRSL